MYRLNEEQQRVVADAAAVADANIKPQAAGSTPTRHFPGSRSRRSANGGLLG